MRADPTRQRPRTAAATLLQIVAARWRRRSASGTRGCLGVLLVWSACGLGAVDAQPAPASARYGDPSWPVERRVAFLLGQMTLEEKVAQMRSAYVGAPLEAGVLQPDSALVVALTDGIGALQRPGNTAYGPREGAAYVNAIQRYLIERTRLGIPALIQEELLVGHLARGATTFPQPIALASSWDTLLVRQVYSAIAAEARSRGGTHALTPTLDVARDPRWGRMEETYGEDTHLTSQMAVAAVTGMQGGRWQDGIDGHHVAATGKHFFAYGQGLGGRNFAPPDVSEWTLRDDLLPPFRAAVRAGLAAVMPSHSAVGVVPAPRQRAAVARPAPRRNGL